MTDMTSNSSTAQAETTGMGRKLARRIEYSIIGLCLLAMMLIFQPFFKIGFTIGCVLVVVGGLAFNLVPFCDPNKSVRQLLKAGVIVLVVFVVAVLLALGSAQLYGLYLSS
jgi:hypothetical protein